MNLRLIRNKFSVALDSTSGFVFGFHTICNCCAQIFCSGFSIGLEGKKNPRRKKTALFEEERAHLFVQLPFTQLKKSVY